MTAPTDGHNTTGQFNPLIHSPNGVLRHTSSTLFVDIVDYCQALWTSVSRASHWQSTPLRFRCRRSYRSSFPSIWIITLVIPSDSVSMSLVLSRPANILSTGWTQSTV